ncbi:MULTISPECIES: type I-C CRISPR-associated endonuclease Cas1c [Dethiosulfovibrio]|uniref:CRISPR-associated endonuclease Cas1 n=2 Tax=Dethiosulfovibrio TaxID=47054 RepID=A0ABS9EQ65_9BACT|nr:MULTISPECIES: type I-C CRISPR-associated endonuclease Cas1c [Dethiosulfovibrio]MCF4114875.1 type I-C CRISPR-associated endonuclease Cas1c [Dethiosulfovibrio russensis]MCF4142396.1 type I-C CRISPR-associated endonuclease Cas1c [Dethiosulfovibrio marinus]MCF4145367.1 type I-C CRISPR-associated endonuclease Cas1c [Dethiosulfovibrio acidaminovorans]MEA3284627.1 type I-C CRISPR-associated endonuclease Cas1c [Synergistota bacterium]
MKKLLNTLFVMTQGAYLAKKGETVVVKVEREERLRLPIHNLEGICCFGNVSCSPFLMGLCGERGIGLSFFSESGRFMARSIGPISGNVLLRKAQYRFSEDGDKASKLARNMIVAKIANCRTSIRRGIRDAHVLDNGVLETCSDRLTVILAELKKTINLASLRGKEGEAARAYFSAFGNLITSQSEDFSFHGRNRRPPLDNVNALLSFVYTLLCHDVSSALESVGLDPQVGFLHRDRPGRPSLALDLMEELRPLIADRLVISLINRRQVSPSGFIVRESGGVTMNEETRKKVLGAYQKRKQDEFRHPFLDEKISLGLLPYCQSLLLARFLRGDLPEYPPLRWR